MVVPNSAHCAPHSTFGPARLKCRRYTVVAPLFLVLLMMIIMIIHHHHDHHHARLKCRRYTAVPGLAGPQMGIFSFGERGEAITWRYLQAFIESSFLFIIFV